LGEFLHHWAIVFTFVVFYYRSLSPRGQFFRRIFYHTVKVRAYRKSSSLALLTPTRPEVGT
jgi:hypothetical protein